MPYALDAYEGGEEYIWNTDKWIVGEYRLGNRQSQKLFGRENVK